jgi:succinoglycan biosynthesis protein ExoA
MSNPASPTCRALVVIPCLNEAHHLEKLVCDLAAGRGASMRIVIVDGGSADGTIEIAQHLAARFSNVSLLMNPRRIQSAGVNLAVRTFGDLAEYVIRVDAHAEYPQNYCESLIEEAERTRASSVVVAMRTIGTGCFQQAVAAAQNSRLGNGGAAHRLVSNTGRWTNHGHHALMRTEAFSRVGGYDESFSHNEDAELDVRLGRNGFRIWLTGRVMVDYFPRATPTSLFRQYVHFGAGRAKTMIKHSATPQLRQMAPAVVLPMALLAMFAPIEAAAAIPLGSWALVCIAYGMYLAAKQRRLCIAAAGPAAMIMHMGWSVGFWKAVLRKFRSSVLSNANSA